MRRIVLLVIVCLLLNPLHANAGLFQKKDYKQIFLNDAYRAEQSNNSKSAFHSYEKAMYYYKKDKSVIEAYAKFCERQKYYEKAEDLYDRLYILTKDNKYLFKANLASIKNGKLDKAKLHQITEHSKLNASQRIDLNKALIFHFAYKNDWHSVQKACKNIPQKSIDKEIIATCTVASERLKNNKEAFDYYQRFSELYPDNSEIINKIIALTEKNKDYKLQEIYVKKLMVLNPNDSGIKYRLAGVYEKMGEWHKAVKVYEALMLSGDKSEHVKSSHAYVLERHKNPKFGNSQPYVAKPLSGYKLAEENFYDSLNAKQYKNAQKYLGQMLRKEPNNPKLLRHKIDVETSLENFSEASRAFEKLQKIRTLSVDEQEFLAYIYSKTGELEKTNAIIQNLLKQNPSNKSLLELALGYAMSQKKWEEATGYAAKLVELEPTSEKYLKTSGDLYAMQKDFPKAINAYEELILNYPNLEYKVMLANLYMANQNFMQAQSIIEPIYKSFPDKEYIVSLYLNTLLAQQKTAQAYWIVKKHHLEKTKIGLMVIGDMAMKDKDYKFAEQNYFMATTIDPEDTVIQNKLADAYRMLGYKNGPRKIFNKVLEKDPKNYEARLGLGSLEIDAKNYDTARDIFYGILQDDPNYRPAKVAIAHSYIAQDYKLTAIDELKKINQDDETKMMKAQAYYDMNMWSDSKEILKGVATKDAEELKYKIRRDDAIAITPSYSFMFQKLADEFNLDYFKGGINVSNKTINNTNVFVDYNVYVYQSGARAYSNNVTNEFKIGLQSRPNEDWEYRADVGVKAFQFGNGDMLLTDSWIKRYFGDKFSLKLGVRRNNIEQSYVSAVGTYIDGVFTGRAADNKFYLEFEGKLPRGFYYYGKGAYGIIPMQNTITNQYGEGLLGLGKLVYNNPRNVWVNKVGVDIVSYNSAYQYNLLKLYSSTGQLYGGYFSPSYFNATTLNVKVEGNIKKWRLRYGIKGFGGIQTAMSPDSTTPTWGFSPYIAYDLNDNISINASYDHYNFADVQRDIFIVSATIRGFRKNGKN